MTSAESPHKANPWHGHRFTHPIVTQCSHARVQRKLGRLRLTEMLGHRATHRDVRVTEFPTSAQLIRAPTCNADNNVQGQNANRRPWAD